MIRLGKMLSAIVLAVGVFALMAGDEFASTAIVAGIVSWILFCIQPAKRYDRNNVGIPRDWLDRVEAMRLRF